MRLLSAAIFCVCMPILVAPLSAFAGSKNVHSTNICVIEIMRETNSRPTQIVGGWEFSSPKIEDADVEWNPTWLGNEATANLFCRLMGLGDAMRIEGSLTPYVEWELGHGGKSLQEAPYGWITVRDTPGRFRFDKIQCQEKFGSAMAAWLEDYANGRANNTTCR